MAKRPKPKRINGALPKRGRPVKGVRKKIIPIRRPKGK